MSRSKCPANMKPNKVIVNPDNPLERIKIIGFPGLPGYRYHPTKGLRKQAGYSPAHNKAIPL